jgi:hypothetical protein
MTTRRALLFAALICLSTAIAPALAEKTAPLQVTFYYLPG